MLEFEDALDFLNKISSKPESVQALVSEALQCVLAENIHSPIDVPPADNSAMDGYALNVEGLKEPCTLALSQRINAGAVTTALENNTAARIFTGAEIPTGANCVVMQENCEALDNGKTVHIKSGIKAHANIRKQGQDIPKGSLVLERGRRLKAADLGLLASIGLKHIKIYRPLKIALFSTGDELIQPGNTLQKGQIYDSNRIVMEAMCSKLKLDVISSEHIDDSLNSTIKAFKKAAENADIILSCGGVSVGEEDHVKAAVESLGKLNLWKIRIKPGKPFAFGEINSTSDRTLNKAVFIGLPGNPVSAYVTMQLFGAVIAARLQGETQYEHTRFFLKSGFDKAKTSGRPEFIRVKSNAGVAQPYGNQSSGVLSSVSWADALALIPENTAIQKGDLLEVFIL